MKLNEYISTSSCNATDLARSLNVSPAIVSYWISGDRVPSKENCKRIEFATRGAVTCEELRPDLNWDYLRTKAA